MTGLFIGRFQPFHHGHKSVLEAMMTDGVQRIIIGIGSSQYSGQPNNPWTAEQRRAVIEVSIQELLERIAIEIIDIPDIHDDAGWVSHVDGLVGGYDVIYSGNQWVKDLMEAAGHTVKPIEMKVQVSATMIRDALKNGDDAFWQAHIHPGIHDLLKPDDIPEIPETLTNRAISDTMNAK